MACLAASGMGGVKQRSRNEEDEIDFDEDFFENLRHTVWNNSRIPKKVYDVISGFSHTDANYYWDVIESVWDELNYDNTADFMNYCPDEAVVSVPGRDVSARFDELGRASGFMVDGSEQIPYKQHRNVDRTEGIFSGVKIHEDDTDGEVRWLPFEADISVLGSQPGFSKFKYELEELEIVQDAFIDEGSLKLSYSVKNSSDEDLELEFFTRGKLNANENFQNPIAFESELNEVKEGDSIVFDSLGSDAQVEMSMEDVDRVLSGHEDIEEEVDEADRLLLENLVMYLMDDEPEARDYSELPDLENLIESVEEAADLLTGRYSSGLLKKRIELSTGQEESFEVEIDAGKKDGSSMRTGDLLTENLLGYAREDGGFSASHNLKPMYYPAWIRDSMFSVEALGADHQVYAERIFNGFLPKVQRENGSFNQCYHADGSETGTWYSELDQPAIIAALMPKMEEEHDLDISREGREMYAASVIRIVDNLKDGILAASPDYAELPIDGFRKSLWANAYAYEALDTASEMDLKIWLDDDSPEILKDYSDRLIFSFEDYDLAGMAENISERIDYEYFDGDFKTNAGIIGEDKNPSIAYARILTDTDALNEDQEELLLEYLNEQKDLEEFWTPGLASLGYAMRKRGGYEEEVEEIEDALADSITEAGHLPERVKADGNEDASELAWGLAEAKNLFDGSQKYDEPSLSTGSLTQSRSRPFG